MSCRRVDFTHDFQRPVHQIGPEDALRWRQRINISTIQHELPLNGKDLINVDTTVGVYLRPAVDTVVDGRQEVHIHLSPCLHGSQNCIAIGRILSEPGSFAPLHVSEVDDPPWARILRSFESGHTNVSQIDEFALSLGVQVEPVRMDSQAKYALLAAGEGELILRLLSPSRPDYREKVWDQAAGSLILEQAGGRITDLDGKALDFTKGRRLEDNRGVLASNGLLHETALRALKEIGV